MDPKASPLVFTLWLNSSLSQTAKTSRKLKSRVPIPVFERTAKARLLREEREIDVKRSLRRRATYLVFLFFCLFSSSACETAGFGMVKPTLIPCGTYKAVTTK